MYDGPDVAADVDGAGTLVARYVHGDGVDREYGRVTPGGAVRWYVADRQGSVAAAVETARSRC